MFHIFFLSSHYFYRLILPYLNLSVIISQSYVLDSLFLLSCFPCSSIPSQTHLSEEISCSAIVSVAIYLPMNLNLTSHKQSYFLHSRPEYLNPNWSSALLYLSETSNQGLKSLSNWTNHLLPHLSKNYLSSSIPHWSTSHHQSIKLIKPKSGNYFCLFPCINIPTHLIHQQILSGLPPKHVLKSSTLLQFHCHHPV